MKKVIATVLALSMCLFILSACGSPSSGNGTSTTAPATSSSGASTEKPGQETATNSLEGKKIALILKALNEETWLITEAGALAAGEELGVQVDVFAPVKAQDNEQQILLIQEAIAKQYDVICISPCDSEGVAPAVQEANAAGIPVLATMTQITAKGVDVASYIAIDNIDAQYKVTKAICERMQSGEIVILEGPAGQQTATDKVTGAMKAISEYEGIEVVASQSANWSRTEAYSVMQNLLQAHPNIKGVAACNGAMALGAVQALDEVGKAGEVYVCSMNCDADGLEALKNGTITVDLDNMPYEVGYMTIEVASRLIRGEQVDPIISVDTTLVTQENVDEMIAKKAVFRS